MRDALGSRPEPVAVMAAAYAYMDEDEPQVARWFVVRTKPQAEKRARAALIELGFDAYLPVETRRQRRARVTQKVERALIPGYLFVELLGGPGCEDFYSVRQADGVEGFLHGASPDPMPVPVYAVMALRQAEAEGRFDRTRPAEKVGLAPGAMVKIVGGPFQGYVGRIAEAKPNERYGLLVQMFGRETALTLDEDKLEPMG